MRLGAAELKPAVNCVRLLFSVFDRNHHGYWQTTLVFHYSLGVKLREFPRYWGILHESVHTTIAINRTSENDALIDTQDGSSSAVVVATRSNFLPLRISQSLAQRRGGTTGR
ncbi:hypothetical protein [Geomonas limicola]|uniref:hypothetical protein n=1 Tax=Geomonas limicola TaxID=2740186 RepID=UPI001612EC32|nr:hypothetical protein [Geomonas limicola]